jgi:hypothetical protein
MPGGKRCKKCAGRSRAGRKKSKKLPTHFEKNARLDKQLCTNCDQTKIIEIFERLRGTSTGDKSYYSATCHSCLRKLKQHPSPPSGQSLRSEYIPSIQRLIAEITSMIDSEPASGSPLHKELLRMVGAHPHLENIFAPMATLEDMLPDLVGQTDMRGNDTLPRSSESGTCQVLCASTDELLSLMHEKTPLPDVPCIYIPKDKHSPLVTREDFVFALKGAWKHTNVEFQKFSTTSSPEPTGHMPGQEFAERIQYRTARPESRQLGRDKKIYNLLNLAGDKMSWHRRHPALDAMGMRLLGHILDMVKAQYDRDHTREGIGKTTMKKKTAVEDIQHVDLESCLKFVLYGERGVISGYHADVLNGTYVMVVSGYKLWFVPSRRLTELEETEFGSKGPNWQPPPDLFRAVVLRPGDTFVMRSGYLNPHFVLTGEDSLTIGGMEWVVDSLPSIMQQLKFIIPRYNATNEDVPRQLPDILNKLEYLVMHSDAMNLPSDLKNITSHNIRTSVSDTITWLKKENALHCNCAGRCGTSSDCLCRVSNEEDGVMRTRTGCTSWCHPERRLVCLGTVKRTGE